MNSQRPQFDNPSSFLRWWLQEPRLPEESQLELNKYYLSYIRSFDRRMQYWYTHQLEPISKRILLNKQITVLDVGCGCGTESLWMAILGAKVIALDPFPKKIACAKARKLCLESECGLSLDVQFIQTSVLNYVPDRKIDLIWMEQAFHHLEPRDKSLDHLAGILNSGGRMMFSESNAWNPLLQLQLLKFRGLKTITYGEYGEYGNERILTPGSLARQLRSRGLKVLDRRYFRVFPNHPLVTQFMSLEEHCPQLLFPLFTHYFLEAVK